MTNLTTVFPRSAFVGFDHLLNELDRVTKQAPDHYPPHNIVKLTDNQYLIELAVAGFDKDEITIYVENRSLTITGEHKSKDRDYIHHGISAKKFKRVFTLSEYVHVEDADINNGILTIYMKHIVPEALRPRTIPISQHKASTHDTLGSNTKQLLTETNK